MALGAVLLAQGIAGIANAVATAYAASAVLRRRTGAPNDSAHLLLAGAWIGLCVASAGASLSVIGIALGGDVGSFGGGALTLGAVFIPFTMWCVSAYLAFLVRGRHDLARPLAILHVGIAAFFLFIVGWAGTPSILSDAAGVRASFPNSLPTAAVVGLIALAVIPFLAIAGTFVALRPTLEGRGPRRRATLLAWGLAAWVAKTALSGATIQGARLDDATTLGLTLVLGLLPPTLIALAYHQEKAHEGPGLATAA